VRAYGSRGCAASHSRHEDQHRPASPDYVVAHMWFNLAAAQSSGEERDQFVKNRDLVAAEMTAEQIAEAQRRAREWTPTPEP